MSGKKLEKFSPYFEFDLETFQEMAKDFKCETCKAPVTWSYGLFCVTTQKEFEFKFRVFCGNECCTVDNKLGWHGAVNHLTPLLRMDKYTPQDHFSRPGREL